MLRESNWGEQRAGHYRVRKLIRRARGSVHGEHDIYFRGPVKPGMALQWKFTLPYSARQTRGGVLVAQRILLSDSAGSLVVEHLWSTFYVGGTIDAEVGPPLADHTFPEEACTFGLSSGVLVDVAAGGDPGRLRRLACRFSAPAFPRQDLTVHLYDAGLTEEGGQALAFEATRKTGSSSSTDESNCFPTEQPGAAPSQARRWPRQSPY